jgi:uncharacterized membrane protein
MNAEAPKVQRWRFIEIAIGIGIPTLFFVFRFTAAAAFLVLVLLCIFFGLHRSRRALHVAFALFVAAILIPVDVYVPGFHGPLVNSRHSGPRLVQVLHGLRGRPKEAEAILAGCIVGLHDTKWRLVWD